MSKATRRRYTAEFKAEAVALVQDQGYTIADAARALGIDRKLLTVSCGTPTLVDPFSPRR